MVQKRALVSVSDKTGLVEFVKGLQAANWQIIATGGTQKLLEESGISTIGISEVTGFPEICDGRVKTLHPKVHGALLARRDEPSHMEALQQNGILLFRAVKVLPQPMHCLTRLWDIIYLLIILLLTKYMHNQLNCDKMIIK